VKYWRKLGKSKTGAVDVLLKNGKFKKWHRYWMEMVEYLKLLCGRELAFGGEGEVCEGKCYVLPEQGVCWRQGELGGIQTLPIARCANSACTMQVVAACAV
jgi:hypothetical protein